MSTNVERFMCSCGSYHPVGVVCTQPLNADEAQGEPCGCGSERSHDDEEEEGDSSSCAHDHSEAHVHASDHEHGDCCGHDHADAEPVDLISVGEASATRAIYRIVNMDCPMEEALIRKKLGGLSGITGLEFNLMQRVLTVNHELSSTAPIEAALKSIDMTPEPIGQSQGAMAIFSVNGMDCPTEEGLIKTKLSGMPGLLGLEFNLMQRTLKVRHEPSALPAISEALMSLNLDAKLMDAESSESNTVHAPKIPWMRLAVAGVLAAFSEAFELMGEWNAKPFGLDLQAWQINGVEVIEWLPMILAITAILAGGLTTYKKGWIAVKNFNLNINALMSVAVTGAVIIGQYPEAAMVMVLFNLAEAIEAKALNRARNAIKDLLSLTPEKATMQRADGAWVEMDIRQVAVGSRVRVRPGERVALDGVILDGQSTINQAPITGESMPVEKNVGDVVYAGTINEAGSFEYRVTAGATDSTLARIIHAVEEAQGSKAPMQRFVDQFSKYYTPAVFLTALLVAVIPPLFMGGIWTEWIYTSLVILVIGCPCALVISTPVSIVSGMAAATRHGILIKGGMFLEKGRQLKWLALDKTGTITHGRPRQTDFMERGKLGKDKAGSLASCIAARSDHPVARAMAENAAGNGFTKLDVCELTAFPGQGVSGVT